MGCRQMRVLVENQLGALIGSVSAMKSLHHWVGQPSQPWARQAGCQNSGLFILPYCAQGGTGQLVSLPKEAQPDHSRPPPGGLGCSLKNLPSLSSA